MAKAGRGRRKFAASARLAEERWNGLADGTEGRRGLRGAPVPAATVEAFAALKERLNDLAKNYGDVYTLLPQRWDDTGYPHARVWSDWLRQAAPGLKQHDAAPVYRIGHAADKLPGGEISRCSPRPLSFPVDAQLAAMHLVRPLYEIKWPQRWWKSTPMEARKRERMRLIGGTALPVLHFNELTHKYKTATLC